jgi:arylsulfatase A-like enzyme
LLRRIIDSPWFYFAGAALLLILAIWTQVEFKLPQRPAGTVDDIASLRDRDDLNVIFILVDTLRSDRLSSYGYERPTTPTMDALAKSGIRFSRVESQSSWTKASMASLWTGIYPARTGVTRFSHAIPEEALLPAEIMQDAGMTTAGVWRNGWVAPNFGFSQGFDLYVRPSATPSFEAIHRNPSQHPLQGTDYDATKSALEFLSGNSQDRFFFYIHYMDLHQYTYDEGSTLFGSTYSDFYDNALHWTDRNVAQLYGALEEAGILDRTVIVIASDHGEAFHEHGTEGHAKSLHAEVQNVPWIIALPFRLEEEIVVDTPVANVDIWPTVLELIGLPPMPDAEGRSVVPLIMAAGRNEATDDSRPIFSHLDRNWGQTKQEPKPIFGVVKSPYKLIHRSSNPDRPLLYDHSVDPLETKNLAADEPEKLAELQSLIEEYSEDDVPIWGATPEVELDEMRLNQLRALGYALPGH